MDKAEEIALKVACVGAAATLLAAQQGGLDQTRQAPPANPANCARYARVLFERLTGMPWEQTDTSSDVAARPRP